MLEIRGSRDGKLDGTGLRLAVLVSRYNEVVTRGLLEGALDALANCHVAEDEITVVHVPGALELPVVASAIARAGRHDAILALGAVIQGETDHYEYVCAETTRGCGQVALETGVPVAFGVLTCENLKLARDRSTTPAKNKGGEAARSAVETVTLLRALQAGGTGGRGTGFKRADTPSGNARIDDA